MLLDLFGDHGLQELIGMAERTQRKRHGLERRHFGSLDAVVGRMARRLGVARVLVDLSG